VNKYVDIYERAAAGGKNPRWIDVAVVPLAQDLEQATGLKATISGPFGLRAECVISLNKDGAEGERKYLVLTPCFKDNSITLFYDTGETRKRFEPLTLGDYNGFNNVQKELPESLEEIAAVLRNY